MSVIYLKNGKDGNSFTSVQGGLYDFPVDGGAVSSINTLVTIPGLAVVRWFLVKVLTAPTSAGAATISFGIAGSTQFFMTTTGIAGFVINTQVAGVDFNANPQTVSNTLGTGIPVLMTIGTAALTAGKIAFEVGYTEYDI